jgi:glutamate/tyrosine decarboxylase-like PLP-dependent enzyme
MHQDKPCLIDPVQFGELVSAVRNYSDEIDGLRADVKTLAQTVQELSIYKARGQGMFAGVMLIAGGTLTVVWDKIKGIIS